MPTRIHGIILAHHDFRETDRRLVLYTQEYGKMTVIARGARKVTAKLAGSLEPYSLIRFTFIRGRTYNTVTSAEIIKNYPGIKGDLQKLAMAGYLTTLLEQTVKEQERDLKMFELIGEVFDGLERSRNERQAWKIAVWYATWKLLALLGFHPELEQCVNCRQPITQRHNRFSFRRGGAICYRCYGKFPNVRTISPNALKMLRLFLRGTAKQVAAVTVPRSVATELNTLTVNYFWYVTEQQISLKNFIFRG